MVFEKFVEKHRADQERAEKHREMLAQQQKEREKNKSIDAKQFLAGAVKELPQPYLIVRDSPDLTYQNAMGITFNNLALVINILATEHNYKIISTACDNHTMYVFMEKKEISS